jgi:hypothetical protein
MPSLPEFLRIQLQTRSCALPVLDAGNLDLNTRVKNVQIGKIHGVGSLADLPKPTSLAQLGQLAQ